MWDNFLHISVTVGDDWSFVFNMTKEGIATDITDWTFIFGVLKTFNSQSLLTINVTEHIDAVHGITGFSVPSTDTEHFTAGRHLLVIRYVDDAGKTFTMPNMIIFDIQSSGL